MPIVIRVDPERGIRYATMTGVITDAELLGLCAGMIADPAYDPSADSIFDTVGVERLEVTPARLRAVAELFAQADRRIAKGVRPRVAIIAHADAAFGLARMYEAYREAQPSPKRYLVCRTMEEARRWLGLPDEGRPPELSEDQAPAYDAIAPGMAPVEFSDPHGVRWRVVPRLIGRGADVLPDGFVFSSERGERRFLDWDPKDFFSPREVDHDAWRELLRSATVVT